MRSGVQAGYEPEHVPGLGREDAVVWVQYDNRPGYPERVVLADIVNGVVARPETALTAGFASEYGACRSRTRRWACWAGTNWPEQQMTVRAAYSDTVGIWHPVGRLGVNEDHCAIAPLDERSALVVYAGVSGLAWARLVDTTWVETGVLDTRRWVAAHPRFRERPGKGWWLLWQDPPRDCVWMSCYADGRWSLGDTVRAAHPPGETHCTAWGEMSRDTAERPVLVWSDYGCRLTYRDAIAVARPTADGWEEGEEVPGSSNFRLTPAVARDRNDDVWVAWSLYTGQARVSYIHTYTRAVAESVWADNVGRQRAVRWRLDTPAPGSWWCVLRQRGGEPLTEVARLQAGPGLEMAWSDDLPPAGIVRYRIRRECVDARYRWESPEVLSMPRTRRPLRLACTPQPTLGALAVELTGAPAGEATLHVYDLQGRIVARQRVAINAAEAAAVRVDLSRVGGTRSGIYFVRAVDEQGEASNAERIVLLR